MATYVVTHTVEDVDHWLKSTKREALFGSIGITHRTFVDPQGSNRVALIFEIPDFDAFQELMQTEAAAEAMTHDKLDPATLVVFAEA